MIRYILLTSVLLFICNCAIVIKPQLSNGNAVPALKNYDNLNSSYQLREIRKRSKRCGNSCKLDTTPSDEINDAHALISQSFKNNRPLDPVQSIKQSKTKRMDADVYLVIDDDLDSQLQGAESSAAPEETTEVTEQQANNNDNIKSNQSESTKDRSSTEKPKKLTTSSANSDDVEETIIASPDPTNEEKANEDNKDNSNPPNVVILLKDEPSQETQNNTNKTRTTVENNISISPIQSTTEEISTSPTPNSDDIKISPVSPISENKDIPTKNEASTNIELSSITTTESEANTNSVLAPMTASTSKNEQKSIESMTIPDFEDPTSPTPSSIPDLSTNKKTWINVPIVATSESGASITPQLDNTVRGYFANITDTNIMDWSLIDTVPSESNGSRSTHGLIYQGEIESSQTEQAIQNINRSFNTKDMDKFVKKHLPESDYHIQQATPPFTSDQRKENIDISENINADITKKPIPKKPKAEKTFGNTLNDNSQSDSVKGDGKQSSNLGLILGVCIGLFALALAMLALFVYSRRRRQETAPHLLDGQVVAPTTITSIPTYDSQATHVPTGAPIKLRGPDQLRNQSKIMEWQMDHAEASGTVAHILGRETDESRRNSDPD